MDYLDKLQQKVDFINKELNSYKDMLNLVGIPVEKTTPGDLDTDPCIEINEEYSIQICVAMKRVYYILSSWNETEGSLKTLYQTTIFEDLKRYIITNLMEE